MSQNRPAQTVAGTLTRVLYQNAQGWSLIEVTPVEGPPQVACGTMERPVVGEHVTLEGDLTDFPAPGRDFVFRSFTARAPSEEAAIVLYLADITHLPFESILPVVQRFQGDTIRMLDQDPRRLAEVKALDEKQRKVLVDAWAAAKRTDQMIAELSDLGIAQRHWDAVAGQVSKSVPVEQAIRANPWLLYLHNEGLPYNKVRKVAQHLKAKSDGPEAIRAAVLAVVRRSTLLGNCYYDNAGLTGDVSSIIGRKLKPAEVQAGMQVLLDEKILYARGTRLYLRATYFAELNIPLSLKRLDHDNDIELGGVSEQRLRQFLEKQLSPPQVDRVVAELKPALLHGVTLVAARNGGDQLSLARAYRALLQALHVDFDLAAGGHQFATKTSRIVTNDHEIELVPDLLGIRNGNLPLFGQNNPLSQEIVVVFQSELLDVIALDQLLQAIRDEACLVLVGDPDALPPLGPGAPFKHLWAARRLPCFDFRDFGGHDPALRVGLSALSGGALPDMDDDLAAAVSVQLISPDSLNEAIVALAASDLPEALALDPAADVQVVTPVAQVRIDGRPPENLLVQLNDTLRRAVLGGEVAGTAFSPGDKVILMREHYSPNLPSGTTGIVERVEGARLSVRFDESVVDIDAADDGVALGWAHTAYRLNGQHYPLVVVVLGPGQDGFVNREMLYTCCAMATEKVVIVVPQPLTPSLVATAHAAVASALAETPQEA